jgi:hypothetical protein
LKEIAMRTHPRLYRAGLVAGFFWLLCAAPASAQTAGKAGANEKEKMPVLTKEYLFEGTGLSAESQNKVLGNLLKHYTMPKALGNGSTEMKIFTVPDTKVFLPQMAMGTVPTWTPTQPEPDPCASVADEKQLGAMHRLLETTLSSKSMDSAAFAARVPKDCNGQRLRYYLNVTAQLFPEGGKK